MKKYYWIPYVNTILKELYEDGINLGIADVQNCLNDSLCEPSYPEKGVSNKDLPLCTLGLYKGLEFENLSDLKDFVDRLEDLLEDYVEVYDIELSDYSQYVNFNYTRPPNEREIKDYQNKLERYNLIQEYGDYIKTRYSELENEKQDRDKHNQPVLEEIEKLKRTLK